MKFRRITLLIVIIQLFLIPNLKGSLSVTFKYFDIENGLSNSEIRCIYQDSQGYIWVGTQYGLNKYNGKGFETYYCQPESDYALSGNAVDAIFEDGQGNLWIGTETGLNLYNYKQDHFQAYSIFNEYGYRYETGVHKLMQIEDNKLVLLSNEDLFFLDSTIEVDSNLGFLSTQENTFKLKAGTAIAEDDNGLLWITTDGAGIKLFDKMERRFITDSVIFPILK